MINDNHSLREIFIFSFLKIVSGYNKQLISPTSEILFKRLIFVKTYIKLLSVYANRHKNNTGRKERDIYVVISRQLNNLETLVDTDEEMTVLMRELMCVLNISNISRPANNAFCKWIENKPGNGIIMKSFLKCLGQSIRDNDILSDLLEIGINSYFINTGKIIFIWFQFNKGNYLLKVIIGGHL